ncbi:MAG: hypothetical protein K2N01_09295 [Lachnospiraceae bacterium]|nr:hypothetical protein [Lachnospiraceae bacterium]
MNLDKVICYNLRKDQEGAVDAVKRFGSGDRRHLNQMKKVCVVVVLIISILLSACNQSIVSEQEMNTAQIETQNFDIAYEILNSALLTHTDESEIIPEFDLDEIRQYAQEAQGDLVIDTGEENSFPEKLIVEIEEFLYDACDYDLQKFNWEEVQHSVYFELIRKYGSESFEVEPEKLMWNQENPNCVGLFYVSTEAGEGYYVLAEKSGGSNGAITVRQVKLEDENEVTLDEFETQNYGYGSVICYEEEFYYIHLHYNYNLKNFDGVQLHRLNGDAAHENIMIRYLPMDYSWKNVFSAPVEEQDSVNSYLSSIREDITSDTYLENGGAEDISVYMGDEAEAGGQEKDNVPCHGIDFANIGVPVYLEKSNLIPSNTYMTWLLRAKFYLCDEQGEMTELEYLQLNESGLPSELTLVQLWFHEIDGKIYTFRLYHICDYNYVLQTVLIQGEELIPIRSDLILPQRTFVLTKGEIFHA